MCTVSSHNRGNTMTIKNRIADVHPVTMIQPKTSKMPTYACTKNDNKQKCLFYPYQAEIDWLADNASYSIAISELSNLQEFDPRQFLLDASST